VAVAASILLDADPTDPLAPAYGDMAPADGGFFALAAPDESTDPDPVQETGVLELLDVDGGRLDMGDTMRVTLSDADLTGAKTAVVFVRVFGESLSLSLTEEDPGIFAGEFRLAPTTDGTAEPPTVAAGPFGRVTVTYDDQAGAAGHPVTVTAQSAVIGAWVRCDDATTQECIAAFEVVDAETPPGLELTTVAFEGDEDTDIVSVITLDGQDDLLAVDSPLGTDSRIRVVLDTGGIDVRALGAAAEVDAFEIASGDTTRVEMVLQPVPLSRIFGSPCTPAACGDADTRADQDLGGYAFAALTDLRDASASFRDVTHGLYLAANAQSAFFDEPGGGESVFRFTLAGPSRTEAGSPNEGFFEVFLPDSYLTDVLDVADPRSLGAEGLRVSRRDGEDVQLVAPEVTDVGDGVTVRLEGFSYSNPTFTIERVGEGTAPGQPVAVADPTSLQFPATVVGSTSAAQTVELRNSGNGPLELSAVAVAGDFTVMAPGTGAACIEGGVVEAGSACAIGIRFRPTMEGDRTGSLTFTSDAEGSPTKVSLRGTGSLEGGGGTGSGGPGGGGGPGGPGGGGGSGGGTPAPGPDPGTEPSPGPVPVTVTTGNHPTSTSPLEATVVSPGGGPVTVDVRDAEMAAPDGFRLLDWELVISAPPAPADAWMTLEFRIHSSRLPAGVPVTVYRDGVAVARCSAGSAGDPDPCVATYLEPDADRDYLTIVVRTSRASVWSFGIASEIGQPQTATVERWFGAGRAETAAAISRGAFQPGVAVVYVATGADFPDALAGGPLAASQGGPVLLVDRDDVPEATRSELDRLRPERIVVLGGQAVVSDAAIATLSELAGQVTRLSGANRFETAVTVSQAGWPRGAQTVYVATGGNFPDALAGGAAAVRAGAPLLLVTPDELPAVTRDELGRLEPSRIVVLGGNAAVSQEVAGELSAFAEVVRHEGVDRYVTAAAVAAGFPAGTSTVFVATGRNFPDALAGVPAAGLAQGPILLVHDAIPVAVSAQLRRIRPERVVILGGPVAVQDAILTQIEEMLADD
jgi:putative cell wall-binding protein